jgi:cytochrome b
MSQLVQFKLSARDSERAFDALERSSAKNLNLLAKNLFLDFLEEQAGQARRLEVIADRLEEIRLVQQELAEMQRASNPDTALSIMAAIFLLMYRSVNTSVRAELDAEFNSDSVINYLKGD